MSECWERVSSDISGDGILFTAVHSLGGPFSLFFLVLLLRPPPYGILESVTSHHRWVGTPFLIVDITGPGLTYIHT